MSPGSADGGWAVDNLALSLASARLAGALTIGADRLANGKLSFSAANLDDLSPLVLTKLSGAVQAKVEAASAAGRQALSIAATSDRMSVGARPARRAQGRPDGRRSLGAPGRLRRRRWRRAEVGGQSLADVKLTATARGDSSDLDFMGSVRGTRGEGARTAIRRPADPRSTSRASPRTAADGGLRSSGPATLTYEDGGLDIRNFALRVDSGRLSVTGRAGSTLDLHATAAGLPLAALDHCFAGPRPFGRR